MIKNTLSSLTLAAALAGIALPCFAQELTFWSWRQEDRAVYEALIDKFEAANAGITVKFETHEAANYNTILSTALAAGEGPDVMMVRAHGAFEVVASGGYLMPLDPAEITGLDALPAPALAAETLRADGKVYAVPFASQTMLVIYNKALFDQYGLTEPSTWAELEAVAKTLKDNGIFPFANGTATAWQNETIVTALGASIIGEDFYEELMAGTTDFNDPRYVEALAAVDSIAKSSFPDGFIGIDYPSAQQLFTSGMAGMFAGGSFELANFRTQNPDIELGVFPAAVANDGDEHLVGLYFDGGYAGNAKTEHPEAVKKFLTFLASTEFAQEFANKLNNISPVPGVTFDNPLLQEVADLNKNSIPYIMLVHFRYQEPTGSVLLQAAVQKMLAGETTPEAAAKEVTDGVKTYYAPFQD